MNISRNKKIFFIAVNHPGIYEAIRQVLLENNFIENVDFINVMTLLPGQYLNTHFIVKEI
ncbi:MAG: hypothetical protein IJ728_13860 [Selenomonadaceae bacterium]|nr:hypothetical protein [Selenomonadaceae bacterium]